MTEQVFIERFSEVFRNRDVVGAALLVLSSVALGALTEKQRNAVLELYGGKCAGYEVGIEHNHRGRVEVNHDPPQAWSIANGLDPEGPHVAYIPLCEEAHDIYHRRDVSKAKRQYHEGNKESFKEMGLRHRLLAKNDEIFWDHSFGVRIQTYFHKLCLRHNWKLPDRKRKEGDEKK